MILNLIIYKISAIGAGNTFPEDGQSLSDGAVKDDGCERGV